MILTPNIRVYSESENDIILFVIPKDIISNFQNVKRFSSAMIQDPVMGSEICFGGYPLTNHATNGGVVFQHSRIASEIMENRSVPHETGTFTGRIAATADRLLSGFSGGPVFAFPKSIGNFCNPLDVPGDLFLYGIVSGVWTSYHLGIIVCSSELNAIKIKECVPSSLDLLKQL